MDLEFWSQVARAFFFAQLALKPMLELVLDQGRIPLSNAGH